MKEENIIGKLIIGLLDIGILTTYLSLVGGRIYQWDVKIIIPAGIVAGIILYVFSQKGLMGILTKILWCFLWVLSFSEIVNFIPNLKQDIDNNSSLYGMLNVVIFFGALLIHVLSIRNNFGNNGYEESYEEESYEEENYEEENYDEDYVDEYEEDFMEESSGDYEEDYEEEYEEEYENDFEDDYSENYEEEYEDDYTEDYIEEYDDYDEESEDSYYETNHKRYANKKVYGEERKTENIFERLRRKIYEETEKRDIHRIEQEEKQREEENYNYSSGQDMVSRLFIGCNDRTSLVSRYRSLMKTYHPDTGNGDAEMTMLIQEKYKELLNKLG